MASGNHWLGTIETYTFLWQLTLVSANRAWSNLGQGPVFRFKTSAKGLGKLLRSVENLDITNLRKNNQTVPYIEV